MKIGIVGSSKVQVNEKSIRFVEDIVIDYPIDTVFVSGGASGIDEIVEMVCMVVDRKIIIHKPKTKDWEGYKERNLLIAKDCDKVISIALPFKEDGIQKYCYHCKSKRHQKTAGCWTAMKCKEHEVKIFD